MNKDKRLEIRIPESELKASQDTAKALNMHHSEFVREAINDSVYGNQVRGFYEEIDSLIATIRDIYYTGKECPVEAISCPKGALECIFRDMNNAINLHKE